ncbi:MAG: ABC transporter substrate-binding protein [Chloroflexi bacterium]|nr:ABC transporter substrate-binding protein [Chloroflexota bacterium]
MKTSRLVVLILVAALLLAACQKAASPTEAPVVPEATVVATVAPTEAQKEPELFTVRFGNLPYLDYGPWIVAEKMGYLEEQGIKIETTIFEVEQPLIEAMLGGSIDVAAGADSPFILLAPQSKDKLQMVSVHSLFTGYSIMGRPDEVKTYDQFIAEGKTAQEALAAAALQLKGKTIILPGGASFYPVLDTALGFAGLKKEDVEIIDMDPVEGAAAFLQGTGDFYSDGLPSRFRLETEGMVNVLTGVQMGGGAMDTAGMYVTREFYAQNPEVVYGFLKAWYKAVAYIKSNPDEAISMMIEWINEQSGAGMTVEDGKRFLTDLVLFPTYEEVGQWFFTKGSPYYWPDRLSFVKSYNEASGTDYTGVDLDAMMPVSEIYPLVKP